MKKYFISSKKKTVITQKVSPPRAGVNLQTHWRQIMLRFLVVAAAVALGEFLVLHPLQAAEGDLDATFGSGGKVFTNFLGNNDDYHRTSAQRTDRGGWTKRSISAFSLGLGSLHQQRRAGSIVRHGRKSHCHS